MQRLLPILVINASLMSQQGNTAELTQRSIDTALGHQLAIGMTRGQYLEMRRTQFGRLDLDGDGAVTAADEALDRARAAAATRVVAVNLILQYDLDGDGVVTREEVADALEARMAIMPIDRSKLEFRTQFEAEVDKQMRADANGDKRIDGAEMLAFSRQHGAPGHGMVFANGLIAVALTFDEDRDGKTTEAELLKGAEAFFRRVDTDGDGTISRDENQAFRRAIQGLPSAPIAPQSVR